MVRLATMTSIVFLTPVIAIGTKSLEVLQENSQRQKETLQNVPDADPIRQRLERIAELNRQLQAQVTLPQTTGTLSLSLSLTRTRSVPTNQLSRATTLANQSNSLLNRIRRQTTATVQPQRLTTLDEPPTRPSRSQLQTQAWERNTQIIVSAVDQIFRGQEPTKEEVIRMMLSSFLAKLPHKNLEQALQKPDVAQKINQQFSTLIDKMNSLYPNLHIQNESSFQEFYEKWKHLLTSDVPSNRPVVADSLPPARITALLHKSIDTTPNTSAMFPVSLPSNQSEFLPSTARLVNLQVREFNSITTQSITSSSNNDTVLLNDSYEGICFRPDERLFVPGARSSLKEDRNFRGKPKRVSSSSTTQLFASSASRSAPQANSTSAASLKSSVEGLTNHQTSGQQQRSAIATTQALQSRENVPEKTANLPEQRLQSSARAKIDPLDSTQLNALEPSNRKEMDLSKEIPALQSTTPHHPRNSRLQRTRIRTRSKEKLTNPQSSQNQKKNGISDILTATQQEKSARNKTNQNPQGLTNNQRMSEEQQGLENSAEETNKKNSAMLRKRKQIAQQVTFNEEMQKFQQEAATSKTAFSDSIRSAC